MMSRRRALLINTTVNSSPKLYNTKIISSLLLNQSTTTLGYSLWRAGEDYTVDTQNGVFVLVNYNTYIIDYTSSTTFDTFLLGNYCILGSERGSPMYYFPSGCTVTFEHDEVTGLYSVTAHGKIQMFTPIVS